MHGFEYLAMRPAHIIMWFREQGNHRRCRGMLRNLFAIVIWSLASLSLPVPGGYAEPPPKQTEALGLTFGPGAEKDTDQKGGDDEFFSASCGSDTENQRHCDPYHGDTKCHLERPLLCFRDIDAPVPETLGDPLYWTGGILASTPPQPGNRFKTLADANAFCASTFGEGWRVASFHDGGGWTLKGYGIPSYGNSRVWIDIKDQPDATCWSR